MKEQDSIEAVGSAVATVVLGGCLALVVAFVAVLALAAMATLAGGSP